MEGERSFGLGELIGPAPSRTCHIRYLSHVHLRRNTGTFVANGHRMQYKRVKKPIYQIPSHLSSRTCEGLLSILRVGQFGLPD